MEVVVILIYRRATVYFIRIRIRIRVYRFHLPDINLVALLSDRATLHPIQIIHFGELCDRDSLNVGLICHNDKVLYLNKRYA